MSVDESVFGNSNKNKLIDLGLPCYPADPPCKRRPTSSFTRSSGGPYSIPPPPVLNYLNIWCPYNPGVCWCNQVPV